ncbi:hypothetical protein AB1Y20_006228 [Prymnesium parvum]|uniref:Uncharacterized protein n=1 Tax=Prymnesium parvum TaxID=97485 RepID=A0AB34J244_PRYPA
MREESARPAARGAGLRARHHSSASASAVPPARWSSAAPLRGSGASAGCTALEATMNTTRIDMRSDLPTRRLPWPMPLWNICCGGDAVCV